MTDVTSNEVKESTNPQVDAEAVPNEEIRIKKAIRQRDEAVERASSLENQIAELRGMIQGSQFQNGTQKKDEEINEEDLTDTEKIMFKKMRQLEDQNKELVGSFKRKMEEESTSQAAHFFAENKIDPEDFKYYAKKYIGRNPAIAVAYSAGNLGVKQLHQLIASEYPEYINPNSVFVNPSVAATAKDNIGLNKNNTIENINNDIDNYRSPTRVKSMDDAINVLIEGIVNKS